MTLEKIIDLQQQSLTVPYDSYASRQPLSSLDENLVKQFLQQIQVRSRITLHDNLLTNLTKLKLLREGNYLKLLNLNPRISTTTLA